MTAGQLPTSRGRPPVQKQRQGLMMTVGTQRGVYTKCLFHVHIFVHTNPSDTTNQIVPINVLTLIIIEVIYEAEILKHSQVTAFPFSGLAAFHIFLCF